MVSVLVHAILGVRAALRLGTSGRIPRIAWTRTLTIAWEGQEKVKRHPAAARSFSTDVEISIGAEIPGIGQGEAD
jgi:hypothetical protein